MAIGAAAAILFLSVLAIFCAYCRWTRGTRWRWIGIGPIRTVYRWVASGIFFSLVAVLAIPIAVVARIFMPKLRIELLAWLTAVVASFVTFLTVCVGLGLCRYGDAAIRDSTPDGDAKFDFYVNFSLALATIGGRWEATKERLKGEMGWEGGDSLFTIDISDFQQKFFYGSEEQSVLSCCVDWTLFAGVRDPCDWDMSGVVFDCIGHWSVGKFKDYMCYEYKRQVTKRAKEGDTPANLQRYDARLLRDRQAFYSMAGLYHFLSVFIGIIIVGLLSVIIVVAVVGLGWRRDALLGAMGREEA